MKQFDSDMYDEGLKSLGNGVNLSQEEHNKLVYQINTKMGDDSPKMRQSPNKWRYYLALVSVFLVVTILSLPQLSNMMGESNENTVKDTVERYYEVYNNKDFETFYSMLSENEQEELEANNERERILKGFEKAWRASEIVRIEEQDGGTENGTIVAVTVYLPPHGSDPEITFIETFKLIKVNDEWKFDDYISREVVN